MKKYIVGMHVVKNGKIIDGVYCLGLLFDSIWNENDEFNYGARTIVFTDYKDAEKFAKKINLKNNKIFDKLYKKENVNRNEYRTYIQKLDSPKTKIKLIEEEFDPFYEIDLKDYPSGRLYKIEAK